MFTNILICKMFVNPFENVHRHTGYINDKMKLFYENFITKHETSILVFRLLFLKHHEYRFLFLSSLKVCELKIYFVQFRMFMFSGN